MYHKPHNISDPKVEKLEPASTSHKVVYTCNWKEQVQVHQLMCNGRSLGHVDPLL